jgi:hypothetical protein
MTEIERLYQQLLLPSDELVTAMSALDGDIMVLGAGGKMGPGLARLARRAIARSGTDRKVTAVSRFSDPGLQQQLEDEGINTRHADLLNDDELKALPYAGNIIYLAGTKFGTTGKESYTWAMNAYLPGRVAEKYKDARIVVFSTGNVYPLTPVNSAGASERQQPQPVGEYEQSCLGRERVFQYFSSRYDIPMLIFRLNYAIDVTYGVLVDIALAVKNNSPVDLGMGYANVIWQGEANERALRSLLHCELPARLLNIAGPAISVREVARGFAEMFGTTAIFTGQELPTALLSDATDSIGLFGPLKVTPEMMMRVIVDWINEGGKLLNKPTHFQEREGQF